MQSDPRSEATSVSQKSPNKNVAPFKGSSPSIDDYDCILARPGVGPALFLGTVVAFAIGFVAVSLIIPNSSG